MKTIKSAVMCIRFKTIQKLVAASNHSLRFDKASKVRLREGAKKGDGYSFTILKKSNDAGRHTFEEARDVRAAYAAQKVRFDVKKDNGDLGAHLIVCVSKEWIAEAGSIHDRQNPRNQAVFQQAVSWSEATFGKGATYNARMDMDEKGGGVVDLFIAPVRIDGRSKKPRISMNKALEEVRKRHGRRKSYQAVQDSWAEWCQAHLSPVIERGTSKIKTKAENLSPDDFEEACSIKQAELNAEMEEAARNAREYEDMAAESLAELNAELAHVRSLREVLENTLAQVKRIWAGLLRFGLNVQERVVAETAAGEIAQVEHLLQAPTEEENDRAPHP